MGGSQSTVSVTEEFLPTQPPLETNETLKGFTLEGTFASSGQRMYKSYRVRYNTAAHQHNNNNTATSPSDRNNNSNKSNNEATAASSAAAGDTVVAVLKVAYLQGYDAEPRLLKPLAEELQRLRQLMTMDRASNKASASSHIWPSATAWFGPSSFKGITSIHPAVWIRPHVYTTLGDRLINRPWLDGTEKLFLILQLLKAVDQMHTAGLVHGNLTTHNIGYTSTGWLVLLDVMPSSSAPPFRPTFLPHDDPTEYLYCFSKKYCYLAPERFDSKHKAAQKSNNQDNAANMTSTASPLSASLGTLTPAMDIFSLGCCLVELALNGESCFDLGQLLEYRKSGSANNTTSLTQKLQKMESSALRAACRHMLSLDPAARLSASRYLERLQEQCVELQECRKILDRLYALLESLQRMDTPDARIHALYQAYPDVLFDTMGIRVEQPSLSTPSTETTHEKAKENEKNRSDSPSDLWTETEELLKELEAVSTDYEVSPTAANVKSAKSPTFEASTDAASTSKNIDPRTPLEESCLLIYVQQILSIMRHVQRPATKQVGLDLIQELAHHVSDETRLQRIVPVVLALLKDSDSLVRAKALHTVTQTLVMLQSFPPSDAQVMPQYVFKRVAPLLTDASLTVRLALAQNMGGLAETAHRFLDISHAVRLYQAVEGGGPGSATSANASGAQTPIPGGVPPSEDKDIFEEKVTQLLDSAPAGEATTGTVGRSVAPKPGTILIRSTYQAEHDSLAETLSRWVVHVCTDQSENASIVKRALLSHSLEGLCSFFSLEGVMAFILPQLLAFLNDRQDWQLRSALFAGLPTVCRIIGKGASQEFVLPCIETGLVDAEEQVIAQTLSCLARLIEQGLLSKALVVSDKSSSLLDRYAALFIHPSKSVRRAWIHVVCATSRALGSPDCVIYVRPILLPFVRFNPSWKQLSRESEMVTCLKSPWNRKRFTKELTRAASNKNMRWTAVGVVASDIDRATSGLPGGKPSKKEQEPILERMQSYLHMLAKHNTQTDSSSEGRALDHIEGSLKLAQSVVFPRRSNKPLPDWYRDLREKAETENSEITEASAIRSVSALGSVYGLSIMGPTEGSTDVISAAEVPDDLKHESDFLGSDDSKAMELAFMGKWESEVTLDPEVVDTSLLATKLRALKVPTLPPVGGQIVSGLYGTTRPPRESPDWKPRVNSVIASSSTIGGHTAPVARLAVALDSSFFVSASHDGTCAVWEVPQLEQSSGFLEPSTLYRGHMSNGPTRVNDVSMVEGTYSVVSGASNGAVHSWRVELVSSPTKGTTLAQERRERSRVVGTSSIREVDPAEGEVLAVSHFSSVSSSVVVYATQKGTVRTWDLRSSEEPLSLHHGPKLGHLSSMALGGDRNWIVTGFSRGFLTLWDVRFQQPFKTWRHSRGEKINRLAASFVPPPQTWGSSNASTGPRPYVFVGSPNNESAMYDVLNGSCVQCFRAVPEVDTTIRAGESMPSLLDVSGRTRLRNGVLSVHDEGFAPPRKSFSPTMNCMVGSIQSGSSFLLTGGSDGNVRFWDFVNPSRCYTVSGASNHPRPTYERIDFDTRRLILCRQFSNAARKVSNGTQAPKKPDFAIEDIKILSPNGHRALLTASRDCTVKVYR